MKKSITTAAGRSHFLFSLSKYLILFSVLIGVSSCSEDAPETWEIVVLVDTTSCNCEEVAATAQKMLNEYMDFDEDFGNVRTACNITFTPVNGQILRPDVVCKLSSAPGFATRDYKKRKEEVTAFWGQKIPTALAAVCKDTGDTSKTYLYHGINHALNEITAKNSDHKLVLLFSDAIENGSISFYDHQSNPEYLTVEADSIAAVLDGLYGAMPAMSGLNFVLVHTPAHKHQHLFDNSRAFLRHYIENGGGHFSFVKN